MILEKHIQKRIQQFLKECGVYSWTNKSMGVYDQKRNAFRTNYDEFSINGVSDILGVLPNGKFIAIEVKRADGRPTPAQMAYISKINERPNCRAFIARSVEQTYTTLLYFWPEIEAFKTVARRYIQLEEEIMLQEKRKRKYIKREASKNN